MDIEIEIEIEIERDRERERKKEREKASKKERKKERKKKKSPNGAEYLTYQSLGAATCSYSPTLFFMSTRISRPSTRTPYLQSSRAVNVIARLYLF